MQKNFTSQLIQQTTCDTTFVTMSARELKEFTANLLDDFKREVALITRNELSGVIEGLSNLPNYTVIEVVEYLKVSKPTLWRWEREGYLVPIRVGCKVTYNRREVQLIKETKDTRYVKRKRYLT